MNPETIALFIPILALSIPIVAIISGTVSKKYKYKVNADQNEYIAKLEARVAELESAVHRMGDDLGRLEDNQRFVSRLLEDRSSRGVG
ncbi:hypothetical protein [Salinispira pacifica]